MDPLIRHLAHTHSVALARWYHQLPLFLLPEDSAPLVEQEAELLSAIDAEAGIPLPFPDLILDFPGGATAPLQRALPEWPDRGRLWVRVRRMATALEDPSLLLSPAHLTVLPQDRWALLEGWEERTSDGALAPLPDFSLIPLTIEARQFEGYRHAYPNPDHLEGRWEGIWCNLARCTLSQDDWRRFRCVGSELIHSTTARLVLLALIYLSEGLGTVLEVRPERPPDERDRRTAELKPWLAPRRRTWIVVDPTRLHQYGHPSTRPPSEGRQRKSPVPHARRGHWRRLPPGWSKARTWVRPAWIGPEEWTWEEQRYKVVFR